MQRDQHTIIAFHEAGHAVMAMACGFRVTKISIDPNEIGMGHVCWDEPSNPDRDSRRRSVLVALSGWAADFIHLKKNASGTDVDDPQGHFSDQRQAREHLSALNENDLFQAYLCLAMHFLGRDDVWEVVDELASFMLRCRSLDGQAILTRLAECCPKIAYQEWLRLEDFKRAVNKMGPDWDLS